jgi:hypothetical protein
MSTTITSHAAASVLGVEIIALDALRAAGRITATTDERWRAAYTVDAIQCYLRWLGKSESK